MSNKKLDKLLILGRLGLVAISRLPKMNNVPILSQSHYLFLPELYGGIAGVSAVASCYNLRDHARARHYIKDNLEKTIG